MRIQLSPRLQRLADYVHPGSIIVDVGTDHAYLPIWLLQNGISGAAYATEIRPGPLKNAASDAEAAGVRGELTLLLCDRLALCPPDRVDTVVIAGMGGETVMGILHAAPWALQKRLILQPQTKLRELRAYLAAAELRIDDASLVYDNGRIYQVWSVDAGAMDPLCWVDPSLLAKRDPLLMQYAEDRIKRLRKEIHGVEQAKKRDEERLQVLRQGLTEFIEIHKEAERWQA